MSFFEGPHSGLTSIVQYRRKDTYDTWHNMAAFDSVMAAEIYFAAQRTDDACPWVYRLIDIEAEAN